VHAEADAHETPVRTLPWAPRGLGMGWTAQAVPFQRSASITAAPVLVAEYPTAVQAEADVHDTAEKEPVGPWGLGMDTIDQAGAPGDGRSGAGARPGTPPGRRGQPGAAGGLTGRQDAGVNGTWPSAGTAGGRAMVKAAAATGVIASTAPAPRATVAKTAAYLPARHLAPKLMKINKVS
jgi:hypothetical protein